MNDFCIVILVQVIMLRFTKAENADRVSLYDCDGTSGDTQIVLFLTHQIFKHFLLLKRDRIFPKFLFEIDGLGNVEIGLNAVEQSSISIRTTSYTPEIP